MNPQNSPIILTKTREENGTSTRYRLIGTFDAFGDTEIFSVFLTTMRGDSLTEDFVYDISRDPDEAARFFRTVCEHRATALHLRELAEDFLAQEDP